MKELGTKINSGSIAIHTSSRESSLILYYPFLTRQNKFFYYLFIAEEATEQQNKTDFSEKISFKCSDSR